MTKRFRALPLLPLLLAVLILGFSGCSKDDDDDNGGGGGNQGPNEVWMQSNSFSPQNLTVNAGTTVVWTNKDGTAHTVTSDTGVFGSGNLGNNATFSFMFATAGSFQYHCTLHPGMTGTITVQ